MTNKYEAESRRAQAEMHRLRSCERKAGFDTEEAAFQKGQSIYICQYCGKWHRSGWLGKLVARVRKKHELEQRKRGGK